jgi:hypothetical protein
MNTNARLITRTAAGAACLAAIFAGATACGTEDGTTSATSHTATSTQSLASARANEALYLQQLHAAVEAARVARAENADAARWAGKAAEEAGKETKTPTSQFGDDRRQSIQQAQDSHSPNDKALVAER